MVISIVSAPSDTGICNSSFHSGQLDLFAIFVSFLKLPIETNANASIFLSPGKSDALCIVILTKFGALPRSVRVFIRSGSAVNVDNERMGE